MPNTIKILFEFVGLDDRKPPKLLVQVVSRRGKRKIIKLSASGEFAFPSNLLSKGYMLEIGAKTGGRPRRYKYDSFIEKAADRGIFRIPKATWLKWLRYRECVSGEVKVCRPFLRSPRPLRILGFSENVIANLSDRDIAEAVKLNPARIDKSRFFFRCEPVCRGRVEVYLRTCCCPRLLPINPVTIIEDLCKIIDCRFLRRKFPRIPEPIPIPIRPPFPGARPDPMAYLENSVIRALKHAESVKGSPSKARVLWAAGHLENLSNIQETRAQISYIKRFPDILDFFPICSCSTKKVAEVPLEADGSFDACFWLSRLIRRGCSRRVQYRVIQLQEDGEELVYDGIAKGESFDLEENAQLHAGWNAESCDQTEYDPDVEPFVLLERIGGNIWADNMIYTGKATGSVIGTDPQSGEISYHPLASKDGLVNPSPAGPLAPNAGPYDQPWGEPLKLRFQFHPKLEDLGVVKYRLRIIGVNDNGNPNGFSKTQSQGLSWRKYFRRSDGTVGVQWVTLHRPDGFYDIPFPDLELPWLGGQYHAKIDTKSLPDGRYLFVLELFDNSGKRAIPQALTKASDEVKIGFQYLRLEGPITGPVSDTIVVQHKTLANLFLVNNRPCYGDIEAIQHGPGNNPSSINCQFLEGPATDWVRIQYSAKHEDGFQWFHLVQEKKGLNGIWYRFDLSSWPGMQRVSSTNISAGFTQSKSFLELLGIDQKCTFTVHMRIRARHTNGTRRLHEYDRYDTGSFAVEIS
jgi:hypothetical protein